MKWLQVGLGKDRCFHRFVFTNLSLLGERPVCDSPLCPSRDFAPLAFDPPCLPSAFGSTCSALFQWQWRARKNVFGDLTMIPDCSLITMFFLKGFCHQLSLNKITRYLSHMSQSNSDYDAMLPMITTGSRSATNNCFNYRLICWLFLDY